MKKLKIEDIRIMNSEDINNEILTIKKRLFDFRMQLATRQQIKPHIIKEYKKQLSQLMTIKHEKYHDKTNNKM
uniref:Large ribosomal subunit protein uL29c n=1 Tax=Galaxaura rugosa TaxID=268570 RepID=A0A1G4NT55_9FLOR|nr:Ribosomal protein L29 [Galaxaura rugosa]SCW21804.1 Ribosomal protein L29 [Galaxaura rugosa]